VFYTIVSNCYLIFCQEIYLLYHNLVFPQSQALRLRQLSTCLARSRVGSIIRSSLLTSWPFI
jgi:hypothetical protein